jgi:hypothetical protein
MLRPAAAAADVRARLSEWRLRSHTAQTALFLGRTFSQFSVSQRAPPPCCLHTPRDLRTRTHRGDQQGDAYTVRGCEGGTGRWVSLPSSTYPTSQTMKRCRPGTHTTSLVHPPGPLHLGLGLLPPCAGHRFESGPCLRHPPFSQCDDDPTRDGAVHELRAYRLARHRPACTVAPVFAAPHPTVMRPAELGGTSGRAGAALLLAAAAASVPDAVLGAALRRRAAAVVVAAAAASVPDAELRAALRRLTAAVVVAAAAASVPDAVLGAIICGRLAAAFVVAAAAASVREAVLGATICGRLAAALVLAPPAASVRDAVGGGAGCALFALLVLAAAAAHVPSAPAKPTPPPRRRERRALPVCLVYDVSHAVPRNASRTRGG